MSHKIIYFIILLLSFFSNVNNTYASVFHIRTQSEFDQVTSLIETALAKGSKRIIIRIHKGSYIYKDNCIYIKNRIYPDASIRIEGRDVILRPINTSVDNVSKTSCLYFAEPAAEYNPWSDMIQCSDTIEIVDRQMQLCRLKLKRHIIDNETPVDKFIRISCWFKTDIFSIERIYDGYIYFYAGNRAKYMHESWDNVNVDYRYGNTFPRYWLFGFNNIDGPILECQASKLICVKECVFKEFEISGLSVNGSNMNSALISICNTQLNNVKIHDNKFKNIGNTVIGIEETNNVMVFNNVFENIYQTGFTAGQGCIGIRIFNNKFRNCGLGLMNSFCVQCNGDNFNIINNTFQNFGYGAIGVGIWHGSIKTNKCSGIIDNNLMFMDADFLENPLKYTLMDSGAIYVWTQTDGISIRNNCIHDIVGVKDNRGIFCDDGTKNVKIFNNVIMRIKNSYCIDLREEKSVAGKIPDHNTGNSCKDNLVDGKIRFFIGNDCEESGNIIFNDNNFKSSKTYKHWRRKIEKRK